MVAIQAQTRHTALLDSDQIARANVLFRQNMNLARKYAHEYRHNCKEEYADLEQLAFEGLLRAARRFDPANGAAFSSFAVPFIKGAILHWLRDHWSGVKVPRRWFEFYERVHRDHRELTQLGVATSPEAVAAILKRGSGAPSESWEAIVAAVGCRVVSLDELESGREP